MTMNALFEDMFALIRRWSALDERVVAARSQVNVHRIRKAQTPRFLGETEASFIVKNCYVAVECTDRAIGRCRAMIAPPIRFCQRSAAWQYTLSMATFGVDLTSTHSCRRR